MPNINEPRELSEGSVNPFPKSDIDQYLRLIPSNPLAVIKIPPGHTINEIASMKMALWAEAQELLKDLNPEGQELVSTALSLAFRIHASHFRKGEPLTPYPSHLIEVAKNAILKLSPDLPSLVSKSGQKIDSKAFVIAVALLHDSFEDIGETIGTQISRENRMLLAEKLVRQEMSLVLDSNSIDNVVASIKHLTITRDDEFPSDEYVNALSADPIAVKVKREDVLHNLKSLYQVAPEYGALVYLLQYAKFFEGTENLEEFRDGVAKCILATSPGSNKFNELVNTIISVCGESRLNDIIKQYSQIAESEDKPGKLYQNISAISDLLSEAQGILKPTKNFPVTTLNSGEIAIRRLGPVTAWGGELMIRTDDIEKVKAIIDKVSLETKTKISGFIYKNDSGETVFHMSRWPRRVGLEIPAIIESLNTMQNLLQAAKLEFTEVNSSDEEFNKPRARAVFGLEEGYFDQRRKNILENWEGRTDKSLESLKRTLELEIGDLSQFGIDINSFTDAQSLIDVLKQKSFTTLHKIEEVQAGLSSPTTEIILAFIYSYDGIKGYRYQEPAVMVTSANTREFFDAAVKVGHSMHQARFSYEDLKGHALNIEILEFSDNAAARMR